MLDDHQIDAAASGSRSRTSQREVKAAIIGSGNIGTDLLFKIQRTSERLSSCAVVGIDPQSEGLAEARRLGVATTSGGLDAFIRMSEFEEAQIIFDATSAAAHIHHAPILKKHGKKVVDLTPSAVGPYTVPVVNLEEHLSAPNLNMVTCGGQATIPIVKAVAEVTRTHYAEIVASIASRSAGPGTRANIDEFTQTTARGLETVGSAECGKAIIILNPAEPPIIMRDTVITFSEFADEKAIEQSIKRMVKRVQAYVPGYRLKQDVQFEHFGSNRPLTIPGLGEFTGLKASTFLEIEGSGDYLPPYAGNLDIMTASALAVGERLAAYAIEMSS